MTKTVYYILNCTWGIIMTLIGAVTAVVLLCMGYKPTRHGGCFCFEIGENWGGINLGLVSVCSKGSSERTKNHEFGHSIQNAYFGPLFPFVVFLPSFARATYFTYIMKFRKDKIHTLPDYDAIWFEGDATRLGTKYVKMWEK